MPNIKQFFSPLKGNILVLTISIIVWNFPQQMISAYEVLYIFSLGGTGIILSLITAIQLILGVFLRIVGGYIADVYGRSRILGIGTIVTSFSYLFYIFAKDWTWIVVGASLLSFTNLYGPALESIKADSILPSVRGKGFVLLTNLPNIPAIISPALGGLLISETTSQYGINLQGVKIGFALLFLGVLSSGLIRIFFITETLPNREPHTKRHKGITRGIFREVYETINHSDKAIKSLIILNGFFMFSFHFGVTFRSAYAVHIKGLSTTQWGLILSISQIFQICTAFIIGDLIDRYGRKKVFVPAIMLLGISTFIFALSVNFHIFLIAMILTYIGLLSRMIALQVLIADTIPRALRGRLLSTTNILGNLGSQGSIIISGFLYDFSPILPYYFGVLMYTVATIVAIKFLKEANIKQQ